MGCGEGNGLLFEGVWLLMEWGMVVQGEGRVGWIEK